MLTDEQAVARKKALENEKTSYETRLAIAKQNDDADRVKRYQGLIKGVDQALQDLDGGPSKSSTKAELLEAAEGLDVDESNTKAEILEALEND